MEDACIYNLDLGDGNALFAVFDGHGGIAAAT
jgi:serine/threonine protein phosphatase PrpC